jgi:class 3 adenylate cyclase/tetratricopeptide (TPR) repeat protein
MTYVPQPIDTTKVRLPENLQHLTEVLAQHIHDLWAHKRFAEGWTYGPQRHDERKQHPDLIPYHALPEAEQTYDRTTAMETLKAVTALGYRLEKLASVSDASAASSASLIGGDFAAAQRVEELLATVSTSGAPLLDLLQVFHGDAYMVWWQRDVRLYRAFGYALLAAGHPTTAFELIREGLLHHPVDPELAYLRALALRRGGNVTKALEYVEALLRHPALDPAQQVEALSLAGALNKVQYGWATQPTRQRRHARKAATYYEHAYQLSGAVFPGINAATMALLAGQRAKARDLAARVVTHATADLHQPSQRQDSWLYATLGEAHLILGDLPAATSWYRHAVHQATGRLGDLAAMRGNVHLLRHTVQGSEEILGLFNIGSIVAFAGHMIDHPTRPVPRFPPDPALENRVRQKITEELIALNATVGYCSAACGADLLFAECMVERGAELHIVLPFDRQDFYATSVDFGMAAMAGWRQRCDAILARATAVHYATTEPFLGDTVLFEFVNTFTQGLAVSRAGQLGAEPWALVVLDPAAKTLVGGTTYFVKRWTAGGRKARVIDLAALRSTGRSTPPTPLEHPPPRTTTPGRKIKRHIKAMLFADVKNFSKLSEAQSPLFFVRFQQEVVGILRASQVQPAFCNTWGDGLYLVFDTVVDCARFALRLLERVSKVHWEAMGLPADTTVRLGLHAGPVYPQMDRLIGRQNFFGSHVNRAARIEPVTTPGCAFASEQFTAALAIEPGHEFVCEYVGVEELAKGYDRCPLYRLGRRE